MNYWIFTTTERKNEEGVYKPRDIYSTRMQDGFWGLGEGTPNRKKVHKGDKVVFYVGIPEMVFAGIATLGSDSFELSYKQREKYGHRTKFYSSVYGVILENIEKWSQPKSVKELTSYLSFIDNKPYWGTYFQGGIRQIPEEDYRLIVEGHGNSLVEAILRTEDVENQ